MVLGVGLGMTGCLKIWPLFSTFNRLLTAVGLLTVDAWLGSEGKENKMFYIQMVFMMVVTVTVFDITAVPIVFSIVLAVNAIRTMIQQAGDKKADAAGRTVQAGEVQPAAGEILSAKDCPTDRKQT